MFHLRARQLADRGRPIEPRRRLALLAGLLVALIALISPLDWYGEHRLLWAHMVQHLLLGDIAPLLVVLGLSGALLRPLLARRWLRPLRGLAFPLLALPIWIVDLALWHLPGPYQAALRNSNIHALEHTCFFVTGALMWAAVIEPLPGPVWFTGGWKAVYTLAVRTLGTIVAFVFIFAGSPLYNYYLARHGGSVTAALNDQRAAGAIMFIEGGVVTVLAFAWIFLRFVRETEVRQRLLDRDVEEAVALRAARYGRSARARDAMREAR